MENIDSVDGAPGKVVSLSVGGRGYKIYLPNADVDYIQKKIDAERKPYEQEMLEDIARNLGPGDLVLDVGANVGNHTLYLAATAGCKVMAFEPNQQLSQAIARSIELNNLADRVDVWTVGVGRESAHGNFKDSNVENLGAQSIQVGEGDIEIIALDNLEFTQPVRVMKIDVEGMELPVLQGAETLISRDRPLLYVECVGVAEFKIISAWMEKHGYAYWDTFNATPTHLFLPAENVSVEKRLARIQYKDVLGDYSLRNELASARKKLGEANEKYKGACEQIDVLKARLGQQQEGKADVGRELEAVRGQLAAANEKYKGACEQIDVLKARLGQQEGGRSSMEQELAVVRDRLAAANEKYKSACEQIDVLKVRLGLQQEGWDAMGEELTVVRGKLAEANEKYKGASEQIDTLKSRFSLQQESKAGVERELETVREKLTAANEKYRTASEQVLMLRASLAEQQEGRACLDLELTVLQKQLADHQQAIDALRRDLAFKTERLQSVEQEMAANSEAHQAEREALVQRLTRVEKESGERATQLDSLQKKLRDEQSAHQNVREEAAKHKEEADALRKALAEQQQQIQKLTDNLKTSQGKQLAAEQRLIKLRASMTYQLGYQLKSGVGSAGGLIRLPGTLLRLYRQASRKDKVAAAKARIEQVQQPTFAAPVEPPQAPQALPGLSNAALALSPTVEAQQGQLRMACVMDEFTFGSYRPECNLMPLTPAGWQAELESFQPELLFIESAWRGKDDLWGSKVGHNASELQQIVAWCKARNIPTLFWNKEDPVHFETFLTTAKQFDYVFTTDIDCIHRYKAALGHDRVYLLPFACQPVVHNPIELYERKDAICFAGAYYVRYPERTRDLGNFVAALPKFRPVEIYDRNFGKNDPNYQFPAEYQPFIVGTLPFDQIDKAYKGYRYSINLNSIKQSQSMFARRVYELLGSNTVTVSNYSRGVRLLFGDLVITTDSGEEMVNRLNHLAGDEELHGKLRLAGLRKVMQEHTYQQRLAYIVSKINGEPIRHDLPKVAVLARAENQAQLDALLAAFQRQQYPDAELHVLLARGFLPVTGTGERVRFISEEQAGNKNIAEIAGKAELVAGMVAADYYGPNYLLDMALATRYSQAMAFGKAAHYHCHSGDISLVDAGQVYCRVDHLLLRSAMLRIACVADSEFSQWVVSLEDAGIQAPALLAIDPYNYCYNGEAAELEALQLRVDDVRLDVGLGIDELQRRAEQVSPAVQGSEDLPLIGVERLLEIFGSLRSKAATFEVQDGLLRVESSLADGKHEYLYAANEVEPEELGGKEQVKLLLDLTPGLNLQLVLLFLDAQKQRISHVILPGNRNHTVDIPSETALIRMGWRVYGGGATEVHGVLLGHRDLQPHEMLGSAEHLLVTNHYPSYQDLYRNGFVHSRVSAYRERGVNVDVFRLRKNETVSYHEFENIDVITGARETLSRLLSSGRYKTVLVHFLDPDTWEVLSQYLDRVRVIVWVHGAEIQPWWRRQFNFKTEEQLQLGKLQSEQRMTFWTGLLKDMPANLKLVFVSHFFAEQVMEDLGFRIPDESYQVIHNPIDTELFNYVAKPVEQRKRILSIRPYASAVYANDLSVKAIERLAEKPWFNELEFRMIGEGPLFEETLKPLEKYPNVIIERRFLRRSEIAVLHKDYGLFLCPSRMDTQGVSRDEAMASGLVPVTNAVAAIPEFADEGCAILAPEDDFVAMAEGIARLVENPQLFCSMSKAAVKRVEEKTAASLIVGQEIELFCN